MILSAKKLNFVSIWKKGTKAQPKEGGAVVPPLPTEAEPCVGALAPTPIFCVFCQSKFREFFFNCWSTKYANWTESVLTKNILQFSHRFPCRNTHFRVKICDFSWPIAWQKTFVRVKFNHRCRNQNVQDGR